MPAKPVIDFQPAECAGIVKRERHIAILFPAQAMYFEHWEKTGVISYYRCELRVWDGKLLLPASRVPAACDNLTVKYPGGSRRCFFPLAFRTRGPSKVIFEFDDDIAKDLPVAQGSAVTLRVLRKVKEEKIEFMRPASSAIKE